MRPLPDNPQLILPFPMEPTPLLHRSNDVPPNVHIWAFRIEHGEFASGDVIKGIHMVFVVTNYGLRANSKLDGLVNSKQLSPRCGLLRPRQRRIEGLLGLSLETFLLWKFLPAIAVATRVGPAEITAFMCRVNRVTACAPNRTVTVRVLALINLRIPQFVMHTDSRIPSPRQCVTILTWRTRTVNKGWSLK